MDHVWRLDGANSTAPALSYPEAFCYRLGAPCGLGSLCYVSVFSGDSLTSFLVNLHFLKCTMMLASNSLSKLQTITAEPCFPNLRIAIKRSNKKLTLKLLHEKKWYSCICTKCDSQMTIVNEEMCKRTFPQKTEDNVEKRNKECSKINASGLW